MQRSLAARASSSATANRCWGLPGQSSPRHGGAGGGFELSRLPQRPTVVVIMLAEELPVAGNLRRLRHRPSLVFHGALVARDRVGRAMRLFLHDSQVVVNIPQAALHLNVLRVLLHERLLQGQCAAERRLRRRGLSQPALRQAEVVATDGQSIAARFPRRSRMHQFALDFHRLAVGRGGLGRAPLRDCAAPKLLYVCARSLRQSRSSGRRSTAFFSDAAACWQSSIERAGCRWLSSALWLFNVVARFRNRSGLSGSAASSRSCRRIASAKEASAAAASPVSRCSDPRLS